MAGLVPGLRPGSKGGVCRYAYPAPDLRELLYRPADLRPRSTSPSRPGSAPATALALYENCAPLPESGDHRMDRGWRTWRGPARRRRRASTPSTRRFRSRRCSRPSVKQVNEFTATSAIAMETKREKRRVAALRSSSVSEAPEGGPAARRRRGSGPRSARSLIAEGASDPRAEAPERCRGRPGPPVRRGPACASLEFGLTEAQAARPHGRVRRRPGGPPTSTFVEDKLARGLGSGGRDVKNLAAYTVAAVRGDYERSGRAANRKRTAASAEGGRES